MKQLIITDEMQRGQDHARRIYAESNRFSLDAVQLGWKIGIGSVIVDTTNDTTITINAEPSRHYYEVRLVSETRKIDRITNVNLGQIASMIVRFDAEVFAA